MELEAVEALLKQYDWSFERVDDHTLAAAFAVEDQSFLIVFQLTSPWLRLAVPAYLPVPSDEHKADALLRALTLNQQTRMVRIAIDDRGDFVLCVDMNTTHGITFADFETALEVVCYSAGALYQQLAQQIGVEESDDGE